MFQVWSAYSNTGLRLIDSCLVLDFAHFCALQPGRFQHGSLQRHLLSRIGFMRAEYVSRTVAGAHALK